MSSVRALDSKSGPWYISPHDMNPTTTEETTITTKQTVVPTGPTPARQAATTGLAVVGFIALVVLGIWLAIALARYVPSVFDGSLGAYVGSIFTTGSATTTLPSSLAVVPTSSTTIPFGNSTASTSSASSTLVAAPASPARTTYNSGPAPVYYRTVTTSYPTPGSTPVLQGPATYHGLPDLTIKIQAVGYLTGSSANSFIVSSVVPSGMQPAVEFTITNIGTNVAPVSRFFASIPTRTNQRYESATQQAINPGDSIQYVLGFTQATTGANQTISVTANFDGAVRESNVNNNTATARITIN